MLQPERDVITRAYEPFYYTISLSGTLFASTLKCTLARPELLSVRSVSTSLRKYGEPGVLLLRYLNDGVSLRRHLRSGKHVKRVFRQPGLPMPYPLPSRLCRHDQVAWLCRHVRSRARPGVTFFLWNIKFECNGDAHTTRLSTARYRLKAPVSRRWDTGHGAYCFSTPSARVQFSNKHVPFHVSLIDVRALAKFLPRYSPQPLTFATCQGSCALKESLCAPLLGREERLLAPQPLGSISDVRGQGSIILF